MLDCMNAKAHLLYLRIELRALWRDYLEGNRRTWRALANSR